MEVAPLARKKLLGSLGVEKNCPLENIQDRDIQVFLRLFNYFVNLVSLFNIAFTISKIDCIIS